MRSDSIIVDVFALYHARLDSAIRKPRLHNVKFKMKPRRLRIDVLNIIDERIEPAVTVILILEHAVVITIQGFCIERNNYAVVNSLIRVIITTKRRRTKRSEVLLLRGSVCDVVNMPIGRIEGNRSNVDIG